MSTYKEAAGQFCPAAQCVDKAFRREVECEGEPSGFSPRATITRPAAFYIVSEKSMLIQKACCLIIYIWYNEYAIIEANQTSQYVWKAKIKRFVMRGVLND